MTIDEFRLAVDGMNEVNGTKRNLMSRNDLLDLMGK